MGLDNYASRTPELELTEEDEAAFEAADIHLAEGPSGFRGKIYQDLITGITGVSMYEHWIPPEVVRQMWMALERCDPEEVVKDQSFYNHDPEVVLELRKFFRVCVERNLGIVASW
jgi:hypothetical protein